MYVLMFYELPTTSKQDHILRIIYFLNDSKWRCSNMIWKILIFSCNFSINNNMKPVPEKEGAHSSQVWILEMFWRSKFYVLKLLLNCYRILLKFSLGEKNRKIWPHNCFYPGLSSGHSRSYMQLYMYNFFPVAWSNWEFSTFLVWYDMIEEYEKTRIVTSPKVSLLGWEVRYKVLVDLHFFKKQKTKQKYLHSGWRLRN